MRDYLTWRGPQGRDTSGSTGGKAVNSKPDPRVRFEPETMSRNSPQPRHDSWLPALALASPSIAPLHWMTRSSRGFSWNRTGRAAAREVRR